MLSIKVCQYYLCYIYLIPRTFIQPVIVESVVKRTQANLIADQPSYLSSRSLDVLSLCSIFTTEYDLLSLCSIQGVQSRATPTGCSRVYSAAEKSLLKPRPLLRSCLCLTKLLNSSFLQQDVELCAQFSFTDTLTFCCAGFNPEGWIRYNGLT